jgi:hypothetical protein
VGLVPRFLHTSGEQPGSDPVVVQVQQVGHAPGEAGGIGQELAAGSLGLVAGFAVPALGTAAACGLVLYFLAAAGAPIRARDTRLLAWVNWAAFFALAVAALVMGLAYHGPW